MESLECHIFYYMYIFSLSASPSLLYSFTTKIKALFYIKTKQNDYNTNTNCVSKNHSPSTPLLLQDLWRWHQIVPVHRIQNARVPHCLRVKVHSSQQMANKRRLPCSVTKQKNKTTLIK